ncbi:MAG: hypothetical protein ACREJ5_17620, partial [Geminicoccaceae bacterium]
MIGKHAPRRARKRRLAEGSLAAIAAAQLAIAAIRLIWASSASGPATAGFRRFLGDPGRGPSAVCHRRERWYEGINVRLAHAVGQAVDRIGERQPSPDRGVEVARSVRIEIDRHSTIVKPASPCCPQSRRRAAGCSALPAPLAHFSISSHRPAPPPDHPKGTIGG